MKVIKKIISDQILLIYGREMKYLCFLVSSLLCRFYHFSHREYKIYLLLDVKRTKNFSLTGLQRRSYDFTPTPYLTPPTTLYKFH